MPAPVKSSEPFGRVPIAFQLLVVPAAPLIFGDRRARRQPPAAPRADRCHLHPAYLRFGVPTVLAWLDADLGIDYQTSLLGLAALAALASLAVGLGSAGYRIRP